MYSGIIYLHTPSTKLAREVVVTLVGICIMQETVVVF
jgi:hypothetical protein